MTFATAATYAGIYLAAAVEGEVVFVATSVLVATGKLSAGGVITAGALGAASGDQLYFYLLRGRLDRWLGRVRLIAARQAAIVARVRAHQTAMVFAIRFAPGLRIAIAAACAYARVSPARFSIVDTIASFAWAISLLLFVARGGPLVLRRLGLTGIWGAVLPAVLILAFFWWTGRQSRAAASEGGGGV
jgi:membrane protein DedA with SNARE-associated domain